VKQGTIADQIDQLRGLTNGIAFLQVTATPYALYLQPEVYDNTPDWGGYVFKPKRPAFTELLPIHNGYVGGDDFFGSFEDGDPRSKLIVEVGEEEQDSLRRPDKRRISESNVLDTANTAGLRRAITTFVAAAGIRQWQQREAGLRPKKYAMVIHNDIQRAAHAWQDQVIDWIFNAIVAAAETAPAALRPIFAPPTNAEPCVFATKVANRDENSWRFYCKNESLTTSKIWRCRRCRRLDTSPGKACSRGEPCPLYKSIWGPSSIHTE
jgi:hypothetical protein